MHWTSRSKVCSKSLWPSSKMQHPVPKHMGFFPFGAWQAADVLASYARSLGKVHQSIYVWQRSIEIFMFYLINQQRHSSLHKAAKILWSCCHTVAVSLSDLAIKCKWQFIISISLQMCFKPSSVSKWYETNGNWQNLSFCLQATKIKQDLINQCFTGRQVTCSKDCAVDLNERCKLRELLRWIEAAWAAETCAVGLRVWASLSTKPRKGTSAQKHEKSKLTLSNTNQSVFVLHRDFHVQCLLFKIYPSNQQRRSSLHKAAKILRSCSHTEAVSLSDLGIKYTSVVNPQTPQTPKNKDLIQNKKTQKNKKAKNNEDKIKTQKIIRKTSNSMGKGCREGSHLQIVLKTGKNPEKKTKNNLQKKIQ